MQKHISILSKSKDPRCTAYSNFYTVLKAITQDKVYTNSAPEFDQLRVLA